MGGEEVRKEGGEEGRGGGKEGRREGGKGGKEGRRLWFFIVSGHQIWVTRNYKEP